MALPTPRAPSAAGRIARLLGLATIVAAWATAGAMLAGLVVVYAIYADLKAPERSHWTSGHSAEVLAQTLYLWHYRDIWQSRADCVKDDAELGFVPRPGEVRFGGPEFDTTVRFEPSTLRAQPPGDPRAPSIVVAGDSYAMGWGVEDDETFSSLLQRHGYRTQNAAVAGYGTARELTRLRRLGLLAHPDAVVIQFCDNDWQENRAFLKDPAHCLSPAAAREERQSYRSYRRKNVTYLNVLVDLLQWTRLQIETNGLRRAVQHLLWQQPLPFHQGPPRRAGMTGAAMAADFLGVLDHFPELKEVPIVVTEMVPNDGCSGFVDALAAAARSGRRHLSAIAIRFEPEDFYRFDGHLTPHGHRTTASQLAVELKRLLGR